MFNPKEMEGYRVGGLCPIQLFLDVLPEIRGFVHFFLLLFICTVMLLKAKTPMNAGVKSTKSFLPKSSEVRVLSLLYPSPHLMAVYKILAQHSAL